MRTHLCTFAGADNRYDLLKRSVEIASPYFDVVHIVDSGSTDLTASLKEYEKVIYTRYEFFSFENVLSTFLRHMQDGDWFIVLDSDEIPSFGLAKNFKAVVQKLGSEGHNCGRTPNVHHYNGKPSYHFRTLPKSAEEFRGNECWTKYNIHLVDSLLSFDNFNGHYSFVRPNQKVCYVPYWYNHMKGDICTSISSTLLGFTYPVSYTMDNDERGKVINFLQKHSIGDPIKLKKFIDKRHPELMELIESFKDAKTESLRQVYYWKSKDFSVEYLLCEQDCCNGGKI